jgi:hypothetical protein
MTLSNATIKDFVITTLLTECKPVEGDWVDAVVRLAAGAGCMKGQFYIVNKLMGLKYGALRLAQ